MLCTFIVVSYNEEDYILEALESIRYQIEQYNVNRSYQLILADDCSQDRTKDLMEFWLSRYQMLFSKITRIYQDSNVGTCRNVADALDAVDGEVFYSTAGDDLISYLDVMSEILKEPNIDILASLSTILKEGVIKRNRRAYRDSLAAALYSDRYVKWSVGFGCPIQCGAAWNKRLNTVEVLNYIRCFKLLDDRTRYYAAYKYIGSVKYKYINKPLLIHRKRDDSASDKRGNNLSVLNADFEDFTRSVIEDATRSSYKLVARIQSWSMKMRGIKHLEIVRYLTPYYIIEQALRILNRRILNKLFEQYSEEYLDRVEKYYVQIKKLSEALRFEYEDKKI